MTRFGVDFAFGRPGGAALAAEGVTAVGRYVPYPGDGGKGLTKDEAEDYFAHGIEVFLFWETVAARHRDGYIAGVNDAKQCLASAEALGVPDDVAFYPAVDFAPGAADWQPIRDYQRGFMSVVGPGRTGIYGNFDVIEYAHDNQLATWFCQCTAWSWKSVNGQMVLQLSDWRHVFQDVGPNVAGLHVDHLTIYGDEFGQWKGDHMGLSKEDMVALFGSTERDETTGELMPLDYRYQQALPRYQEAIDTGNSLLEQVGNALAESKKGGKGGSLKGTTFTGVIN